jgi:hypothetical protein
MQYETAGCSVRVAFVIDLAFLIASFTPRSLSGAAFIVLPPGVSGAAQLQFEQEFLGRRGLHLAVPAPTATA